MLYLMFREIKGLHAPLQYNFGQNHAVQSIGQNHSHFVMKMLYLNHKRLPTLSQSLILGSHFIKNATATHKYKHYTVEYIYPDIEKNEGAPRKKMPFSIHQAHPL